MISEIVRNEAKEIKNPSVENYKNIKPEKEMTSKEVDDFWDSEFEKAANEANNDAGVKEYLDDNGEKYREGDHLLPNIKFEVRGYQYETDDQGRVISAGGKLQATDHPDRKPITESREAVGKGEMRSTDDRGHLIGDRFNGSGGIENLVPMDSHLNRGDYNKLEGMLADEVNKGADVRLKVEPIYEKNSARPAEFKVSYSIDGDRDVIVFKNESEAKV